jgi:hypothetical protein
MTGVPAPPGSARRHRWRGPITLLVLVAFVTGSAWYGWNALTSTGQDATTCTPATARRLVPADVRVNVYNATQRDRLAARTAGQLRQRGFVIRRIANFPTERPIRQVAIVRAAPAAKQAVALVRRQFRSSAFEPDNRGDTTVDVILGESFRALRAIPVRPKATAKPKATRKPLTAAQASAAKAKAAKAKAAARAKASASASPC